MPDKKQANQSDVSDAPESAATKIDHAIVSTDKKTKSPSKSKQTQKYVGAEKKKSKLPKILLVLLLVAVIIGASYYAYVYWSDRNSAKCSDELLNRASAYLEPRRVEDLQGIVDDIEEIEDYEQDPNCLYVIITYYINLSDAEEAASTLKQLKSVYDPSVGYSAELPETSSPPDKLQPIVDFLKQQVEEASQLESEGVLVEEP